MGTVLSILTDPQHIMWDKIYLSLLLFCIAGTQGASITPYNGPHDGYQWHFDHLGVHLDLKLDDKANPMVGGKAHIDLPVSILWDILELETGWLKQLLTPVEVQVYDIIFGKLFDINTVKADITWNGKQFFEGVYDIALDFTLAHKDGTEEKGTLKIVGKREQDKIITTVEVITNTDSDKQTVPPFKLTMVCGWPKAHDITVKGAFGKIFVNVLFDEDGVNARGTWEYLGHQTKYSVILSLKRKFFTFTYQEPGEEPKNFVMKVKYVNGFPRLVISGKLPATRFFNAGEFKTELIQKKYFDFEIRHTWNGLDVFNCKVVLTEGKLDMTLKYVSGVTQRVQATVEWTGYTMKIVFPKMNTWLTGNKNVEVQIEYQPTDVNKPLAGGNLKLVTTRESKPFFQFGGFIGFTKDAEKFEFVLKDVQITVVDPLMLEEIVNKLNINKRNACNIIGCFTEAQFNAKIFIDLTEQQRIVKKMKIEANLLKDKKQVLKVFFTTLENPHKLYIFCPFLLKDVLDITTVDHVEIKSDSVVTGDTNTITTTCNFSNMKIVATIQPTMVAYELLAGQVSYVKYIQEFEIVNNENKSLIAGISKLYLNEQSFLHELLCYMYPDYACFKYLIVNYHFEVVDKAALKFNIKTSVVKDKMEIFHLEFNNVEKLCKFNLKAQYFATSWLGTTTLTILPFEINIEYEDCKLDIMSVIKNKKHLLDVKNIGNGKYEASLNEVRILQLELGDKQIKVMTLHEDKPAVTAIFTWKTYSIFENSLTVQILFNQIAHKAFLGWNLNKLGKAFIDVKFTGSGTKMFGDYELFHHMNWNFIDILNIDLMWNGKTFVTGFPYFNEPLLNDGKIAFHKGVIDMKVVEQHKENTYTLIFRNTPLHVAFLPFFQWP